MPNKKLSDVTIGIITADRYERLLPLLRSLSLLSYRCQVLVVDNSKEKWDPNGTDLGLTIDVLENEGFKVHYHRLPYGRSMFDLRQFLLMECKTEYLWCMDDDVEFVGDPLSSYLKYAETTNDFGFLQGAKVDNRNTEGYKDYAVWQKNTSLKYASTEVPCWYYFYDKPYIAKTILMDCGNVFISVQNARDVGGFKRPVEAELGKRTGEDILLGLRLASKFDCWFMADSRVLHFPKDAMRWATKDPAWLWECIKKECSKTVVSDAEVFYREKFDWRKDGTES